MQLYYIHFEITGDPCNLIGSQQCNIFFLNHTIFSLNWIFFFQANEKAMLKQNNQYNFQDLLTKCY